MNRFETVVKISLCYSISDEFLPEVKESLKINLLYKIAPGALFIKLDNHLSCL